MTITKSALALELKVSKARISQLTKPGGVLAPALQPDGTLDRERALQLLERYASSHRGGWGNREGKLKTDISTRASQRLATTVAEAPNGAVGADELTELARSTYRDGGDYKRLKPYTRGAVDIVNALRHPDRLRVLARIAVNVGCSAKQSYAIAQGWEFLIATWAVDLAARELKQSDAEIIHCHDDDDEAWAAIAQLTGEPFDIQAWKGAAKRVLNGEPIQ